MVYRVFMSGQSNAIGRGGGGPDFTAVDSRVRAWDNVNPAAGGTQEGPSGTTFISPVRSNAPFDPNDGNNMGLWFSHRLAQIRDDDVDFLLCGQGGSSITAWMNDTGVAQHVLIHCLLAWQASGQDPAHVFLWHQGEADVSETHVSYSEYISRFNDILTFLTNEDIIDSSTAIILGGTAEENANRIAFNTNVLQVLAAENPNIYYASPVGLDTVDGTHFSGQSLYTFGAERMFAAYAESEGIIMADLFAVVNEGGTPGMAGTGENKLYNLLNLALLGMSKKDVTLSPDYTGTLPIDDLMTAGMIAAGAVVEYGTDPTNGIYFRFESGLQVCAVKASMTYNNALLLAYTWAFPRPFVSTPFCFQTPSPQVASVGMSTPERTGSIAEVDTMSATGCRFRFLSDNLYAGGDEVYGTVGLAIGFWK